jgi:hypothetical protein
MRPLVLVNLLSKRIEVKDMFLKVVCAWCSKSMGTKGTGLVGNSLFLISHGICPECARKLLEQVKDEIYN